MSKIFSHARTGFGLIELMVAMTIGLVLMVATLTLYLDMSRSSSELANTNTQIESGRLAIELLREDLMHVGFWDAYVPEFDDMTFKYPPTDYPDAMAEPCADFSAWGGTERNRWIGAPLQLHASVPSGCTSLLPNKVSNSDVLVVARVGNCVAGASGCEADTSGRLYWQTSNCDGEGGYVLDTSGFTMHKRDCTTAAGKRLFTKNIYYLRDYAVASGDGIPTLMRSSFDLQSGAVVQQLATPMVEGVEAMRFEFGVDNLSDSGEAVDLQAAIVWADEDNRNSPTNRGDGSADVSCTSATGCNLAAAVNTVLVKVYLLVRNLEPTPGYSSSKTYVLAGETFGPFGDAYMRHVYTTSVRLTNVSGRRETP